MSLSHEEYNLGKFINSRLFEYQKNHTNRLINIIKTNGAALDASDTGTGKTYTALATCKYLNLKPLIICPKSVISTWVSIAKYFNVVPEFVVNYETMRMGNYYSAAGDRVKCPNVNVVENDDNIMYEWEVGKDNIFIFDEVHKCSHTKTYNAAMLFGAKATDIPILMLSATVADNAQKFMLFFYILNFIDPQQVRDGTMSFNSYMRIMNNWVKKDNKPMVRIYHMLYPERASRIRIDDLGDEFPETQIVSEPYFMGKKKAESIEKEYKLIRQELDDLHEKKIKDKASHLVKILRAHQKIELLKVATFVELAHDFLENGYSVVIFVNYTATLETLCNMLKTTCKVYGQQTHDERDKNIKRFMANKERVIVCNIKAGGVGVSLHDTHGNHPRVSILSPTWSSIDMVQALGRVHRAGGKSKSLQRIVYAARTVEESISRKIKAKLKNISSINNGDLDLTNIEFKEVY